MKKPIVCMSLADETKEVVTLWSKFSASNNLVGVESETDASGPYMGKKGGGAVEDKDNGGTG
ncbi:conserved hypothetical protein [Ricinus communis]|uniref:Uncharacterized protein n=1 Tax=Ricinus communis TaxID=3988 RepID=B9SM15_RICCO|nr:conserved hypothetical protein [Ricinus communis]